MPEAVDPDVLHRMLSKYSHPTGFVIDRFVRFNDDGDVTALAARPLPDDKDEAFWYFAAVVGLVYAARAVDFIDPSRSRRSELRDAARAAGFPPELSLALEALQRIAQAEQRRRHARRRRGSARNQPPPK